MDILSILIASIVTSILWIIRLHQVEKIKEDWKQLAIKGVQASIDLWALYKKQEGTDKFLDISKEDTE